MSKTIKLLCLGDCVGRPGRHAIGQSVRRIKADRKIDLVIANGENSAGGLGPDPATSRELQSYGVDVLTSGDHAFHKKPMHDFFREEGAWCIRPANFPQTAPGVGWCIVKVAGVEVGICNVIGRVFIEAPLDCPFKAIDRLLDCELKSCKVRVVDAHAEATSEKIALGLYSDGRSSLVFGTHTHVQTADERITPNGTALITDVGMCGSQSGVIGMNRDAAIKRFIGGVPVPYEVSEGEPGIQGVIVEIDSASGKALSIERVRETVPSGKAA